MCVYDSLFMIHNTPGKTLSDQSFWSNMYVTIFRSEPLLFLELSQISNYFNWTINCTNLISIVQHDYGYGPIAKKRLIR